MTGRCAECRHWDNDSVSRDRDRQRSCDIINNGHALAKIDSFFSDSGHAVLVTQPTFGCVLWEAKEPA
jgi:hypothetical protein